MATAAVTGTATTAPFRGANIVAGGKTIILTLTGDTWVAAGATFDAQRQNIINGMTSSTSQAHGWNVEVKAKIAVADVVRTSSTVVTITLDAEALFSITATEVVTITIPSTALVGAVAIVASPTILVIPSPFTFYVRKIGSDSNDGTTAATAWLTINFALGAGGAGISSGDTLYIGAGVYREVISIGMTSATVNTNIFGDVDGAYTGDSGEVQLSAHLVNDVTAASGTTLLNLNGKDFLTFQDISFMSGVVGVTATNSFATDIIFQRCLFVQGAQAASGNINHTTAANTAANWTIDSCTFIKGSATAINLTLTRPTGADFNYNIVIKNCIFIGGAGVCVNVAATGANTSNGGGVVIRNCTLIASGQLAQTASANLSTTIPCINVYNCFVYSAFQTFNANTSGQIVEDYNLILGGASPRSNTTAGAHSISDGSVAPLFFTGHEYYSVGSNLMPFGMPKPGSPLTGFGNQAGSPSTDILAAARPSGFVKGGTGTATAGAAKTLTDSGQTWGTNSFAGYTVKIISGTGSGQTKTISSNTATVLTVDGNWKTQPSTDSVYEIYLRATSSTGTATAGTTTTLTDSNAAWGTNMWQGYTLTTDSGTGSGQTLVVVSNTATALTFAVATAPGADTTYSLFRGTNVNTINAGVGYMEFGQSGNQSTTTVRSGTSSYQIPGAGYIDFQIPVNAVSTTISIYAQYDAAYSGTLPSMNIVNSTQCGVAAATATQVGAASSWEQLSLTFSPTSVGIVTIRLISSTTTPTGNAFFDDFNIV